MNYFMEQLSMLVASGMTVVSALSAIEQEARQKSLKVFVNRLAADVASGEPLWSALQKEKRFGEHIISLVRIGEESGTLASNLRVIALQQEKDRAFRSKIRSALLYPAFVFILMVVIGVGIAWFILPKLATVFSQLRIALPLITRLAISIGLFLHAYGVIAVPLGFGALVILMYALFYAPRTKMIGHMILFFVPGIRDVIRYEEITRFSYMLGTLLGAGMPIVACLRSVKEATLFAPYRHLYEYLALTIEEGNSFQKSFSSNKGPASLFPYSVRQMIITGEQSGQLSDVCMRISGYYEEKLDVTTKNMSVILEPVLLVCIWFGVMVIALSVILPIYQLVGQLNQ